jgi:hypothetical protein
VDVDGLIPAPVIDAAVERHCSRRWESDLVRLGVAAAITPAARHSLRA